MAKNFRSGADWVQATIKARLGPLSYLIETADGQLWRRHIDHLKGVVASFRNVIPSRMNDSIPQPSQELESDVQLSSMSSVPEQLTSEVREAVVPPEHMILAQAFDLSAEVNQGTSETPSQNIPVSTPPKRYELRKQRSRPDCFHPLN